LAKKSTGGRGAEQIPPGDKASSDYGDDEFDDETLLELDASILVQGDDSTLVVPSEESNYQAQPVQKVADDDFGEFDDDFFDGAEELVAEVEAQHASQNTLVGKQHTTSAKVWGGDDDEYGDDFDDVDFDAVEMAATQASRPFSSNVRTGA
jgi:DNA replication ATP-dependent helicase Dna2